MTKEAAFKLAQKEANKNNRIYLVYFDPITDCIDNYDVMSRDMYVRCSFHLTYNKIAEIYPIKKL